MSTEDSVPTAPRNGTKPSTVAFATFIGTALEWYDFFLYGTMATIALAPLFFPSDDARVSTLVAFLSFAVAFLARPIGAAVAGHYGDRVGRRDVLVITVVLMGGASALIGLLPTYSTIGVWAPILLTVLRAAQGLATGGEWGGATTMALEYAPPNRRALYASIVQLGSPVGTLLSSGVVALVTLMPKEQFLSWGWRLPFLVSLVLTAVGLWIRRTIEETPEFESMADSEKHDKIPIVELFTGMLGRLILGVGVYLVGNAGFFLLSTFMISYATGVVGLKPSVILGAMTIGAGAQICFTLLSGALGMRIGAVRTAILGYAIFTVLVFPVFALVNTENSALVVLAMVLAFGPGAIAYAVVGAVLERLFPVHLRYSGLGMSANLAGIIAGFMPALATWVLAASNNSSWGPASLGVVVGVISLVSTIIVSRSVGADEAVPAATASRS